ncbi:hypothetical protein [Algoriphagus boritolerans]|nr:hypothetical protein [Algoriphagus boritolerans]
MKKFSLLFILGFANLGFSCDPLQQENLNPLSDEFGLETNTTDPNARKGFDQALSRNINQIYGLTNLAYAEIGSEETYQEAKLFIRKSGGTDEYLEEMIKMSLRKYDNIVLKRGGFLSQEAKRKHAAMAAGEHEFEYDLSAGFQEAALDVFIKIPDIPGESKDEKYELVKTINGPDNSGYCIYPLCGGWSVNKGQLVQLADYLETVNQRYESDPRVLLESWEQLKLDSGLDPVVIALLVPAVQKLAEDPNGTNSEDQSRKLLQALDLPDSEVFGDFLQAGGVGALNKFLFGNYELDEDLDWAAVQLNRAKFEMEMFFLWETFWEANQTDPAIGR